MEIFTVAKWPMLSLTALVLLPLLISADGIVGNPRPSPSEEFSHSSPLDEYDQYHIYWKFDNDTITFELHVKTLGWIGLGLSPNGRMIGSDIFMAWVKDGQAYGQDRYAKADNSQPIIDGQQDWTLLMGKEERGYTVIKVTRKQITCDDEDLRITGDTVKMIFAWNDQDPVDKNSPSYHGATQRGTRSMQLLEYGKALTVKQSQDKPESVTTWDVQMDNVTLAAEDTVYWCKLFKVPAVKEKKHVIRVDGLINKTNIGVVHHMVLYVCTKKMGDLVYSDRCRQDDMPVDLRSCGSVLFAWAVGAIDYEFPKVTGFPLGGDDDAHFLLLEMHYDNPMLLSTIVDNSGLRIHYTSDLRQYDAGTAMVGEIIYYPPMLIPPNAENFTIESYCSMDCTADVVPPSGIYIFASFLHTHLLGRKISTRHIRNGIELPEIARDDHYDFNFQSYRSMKQPRLFLPGDELITTCVYNSKERTNMTYSGEGTRNEMCLNFITYYPKSKFKRCLSLTQDASPVYNYVMEKAMLGEIHIDPEEDKRENRTFYHYLNEIKWTDEEVAKFQKLTSGSQRYREYCSSDGDGSEERYGKLTDHRYRLVVEKPHVVKDICSPDDKMDSGSTTHTFYFPVIVVLAISSRIFM